MVSDYQARHPLVQVHMHVSNRVVDRVEEGVDVALRVRSSLLDSGSLVVKHLGESLGLLVASPAQLLRQGPPQQPSDLTLLDSVAMSVSDGRAFWKLFGPNGAQRSEEHTSELQSLMRISYAVLCVT